MKQRTLFSRHLSGLFDGKKEDEEFEVHNVLEGYFIPIRIIVRGILRYLILGESYGRVLIVILELRHD